MNYIVREDVDELNLFVELAALSDDEEEEKKTKRPLVPESGRITKFFNRSS